MLYGGLFVVAADEVEAGVLQGALSGIFGGVFVHGDLFAAFVGLLGFAGVERGGKQLAVQAVGERVQQGFAGGGGLHGVDVFALAP